MKRYRWTRGVMGAILLAAAGCSEGTESPNPLSPSVESVPQTVVEQQGQCSLDGSAACFSPDLDRGITTGQALTSAPINLRASVSGSSVTLSWTKPSSGTPTSYRLEAGTASGRKDIADLNVGNTTSFTASNLAPRKYYVRVRGVDGSGTGPASNEVLFEITGGGSCSSTPGAPRNLTASVDGTKLTLKWSHPSTGCAPTGYTVQAGSSSGSSNVAQIQIGFVTTFVANAPSGTFYLRVRGRNNAGTGSASNEVKVTIGGSGGGGGGGRLRVTRFMTFGDSLTRGFTSLAAPTFLLVPAYLSYPTSLQDRLREAYPGQSIVVGNFGRDGRHCEDDRGRLRDALAEHRPGALLLMHCANDLEVGESGSDPSHVINYLSRLVDEANSAHVPVFLASLPGQDKDGFREKAYEYMPDFANRVRNLAQSRGATYVDVYGAVPNNSSLIGDDGLHLSSSGYRRVAEKFFNAIRSKYGLAAADEGIDLTFEGAGWEVLSNPDYDEDY